MSLMSHRGSIVPASNITYALPNRGVIFHFDDHPLGTSQGKIIYPQEGNIYTLRPREGRFGGALAVEDGTTNWFVNGDFSNGFDGWSNHSTTTIVETPNGPFPQAARRLITAGGTFATQTYISETEIKGFVTVSWWAWASYTRGHRYYFGFYDQSGTEIEYTNYNLPLQGGAWSFHHRTWEVPPSTYRIRLHLNAQSATGVDNPLEVLMTGFQLENKAFPTSFTHGTRNEGNFMVPNVLTSPTQAGAVAFWWRAPYLLYREDLDTGDQFSYPKICQLGTYTTPQRNLTLWLWNKEVRAFLGNDAGTSWDANPIIAQSGEVDPLTWHFFSISWNNKRFCIYMNGEKRYDSHRPNAFNEWGPPQGFRIHRASSAHPNALYDELMILPYEPSPEEVRAWYESRSPFIDTTSPLGVAL